MQTPSLTMSSENETSHQDISSLSIHVDIAAKINFACQQSSFAFLRDLRIENMDIESSVDNLHVILRSSPAFLKQKSWRIDRIAPGEIVTLKDRDIELDGGFLLNLAESVQGTATFTVEAEGRVIGEQSRPVELLAYNEWGGIGYMPELLAAFSMPNDPAVDSILHDAVKVLRKSGRPDGIDGYKSGSRAAGMGAGLFHLYGDSQSRYWLYSSPCKFRAKRSKDPFAGTGA